MKGRKFIYLKMNTLTLFREKIQKSFENENPRSRIPLIAKNFRIFWKKKLFSRSQEQEDM